VSAKLLFNFENFVSPFAALRAAFTAEAQRRKGAEEYCIKISAPPRLCASAVKAAGGGPLLPTRKEIM